MNEGLRVEWVLLGHTSKWNLELLAVNLWSSQWQWKKVTSRQGNRWLDEGDESQGPQGLTVGVLGERINKPWSRLVLICNHPPLLWTRFIDCAKWRGPKYGGGDKLMDHGSAHCCRWLLLCLWKKNFTFNSYFRVDNGFKKLVHKQMNSRPILICTLVFKAWEQNLVYGFLLAMQGFLCPSILHTYTIY